MHNEQRQQTHHLLQSKGIHRALFASWESVKWLTGFAPPVQTGLNLFEAGPALVWYEDGHFTLITIDAFAALAAPFDAEPDGSVITYRGYTIQQPIDGAARLTEVLQKLFPSAKAQIGIEQTFTTALTTSLFGGDYTPIDGWLKPLRMIKTAEELDKLKQNFALTDLGHSTARQTVRAGRTEIEMWGDIHTAIQKAAGGLVPLGNDCVVSSRSPNNIGGYPLDYVLEEGHSLMVDLSTLWGGYWSDSCMTYYATDPTPKQIQMHRTALVALDYATSLVKPGAVAKDIDAKVRQFIADAGYPVYPHHTGHGVGVSGHEEPRIVPYNDLVLEAGMVLMLEPGIYFPGEAAVRLEDAFLVTPDGCQVLTHHDKSF